MASPSGNNIQRIKDAGTYPAFDKILADFVVPDAHATVIDIVDRLGLKGQAAISALCELQRNGKIQPGFFRAEFFWRLPPTLAVIWTREKKSEGISGIGHQSRKVNAMKKNRAAQHFTLISLAAVVVFQLAGQSPPNEYLTVGPVRKIVGRRNTDASLTVPISIRLGYYVDSNAANEYMFPLKLVTDGALVVSRVIYPEPVLKQFSGIDKPLSLYNGSIELHVTAHIPDGAVAGPGTMIGRLRYRAYNERGIPYGPRTIEIAFPYEVQVADSEQLRQPAGGDQPTSAGPLRVGGDVLDAVVVHRIEGKYSQRARDLHINCTVGVVFVVTADGHPEQIRVTKPCGTSIKLDSFLQSAGPALRKVEAWRSESAQARKEAQLFRQRAQQLDEPDKSRLVARAQQLDVQAAELDKLIAASESQSQTERRTAEQAYQQTLDASKDLDDNAVIALMQWLFRPGTKFGQPVPVLESLEMQYALR